MKVLTGSLCLCLFLLAACHSNPPVAPQPPAAQTPSPAATPAPPPPMSASSTPSPAASAVRVARSRNRLFPDPSADWLYSPPTGTGVDISSTVEQLGFTVNTHIGGWDYPVQYTDGRHGCTTFTDTLVFRYTDKICVPNPENGYWPSVGGGKYNDGHLVVVNTTTWRYYDFWKLLVDDEGNPASTNVGQIVSGSVKRGNGTPGTTAAVITGLAGDILPGELDCEDCLQHALQAVVPMGMNSPQVCDQGPAEKTDGKVEGGIFCEGAKLRLDPSVDVDALPASTAAKTIMRALQNYGAVITDQGGGRRIAFYSSLQHDPDLRGLDLAARHILIYY